jgi:hypothetical protein
MVIGDWTFEIKELEDPPRHETIWVGLRRWNKKYGSAQSAIFDL